MPSPTSADCAPPPLRGWAAIPTPGAAKAQALTSGRTCRIRVTTVQRCQFTSLLSAQDLGHSHCLSQTPVTGAAAARSRLRPALNAAAYAPWVYHLPLRPHPRDSPAAPEVSPPLHALESSAKSHCLGR